MVFVGVVLGTPVGSRVLLDQHEQVLDRQPQHLSAEEDDLDVAQPLFAAFDFVLALQPEEPVALEDTDGLAHALLIKLEDAGVVQSPGGRVVLVTLLPRIAAPRVVAVGRVENHVVE